MLYNVPDDQFGQVVYAPAKKKMDGSKYLETGKAYKVSEFSNEIHNLFYYLANQQHAKQIILTGNETEDYKFTPSVNQINYRGQWWELFTNTNTGITIDINFWGTYYREWGDCSFIFEFKKDAHVVYQWGMIPISTTGVGQSYLEGSYNGAEWIECDVASSIAIGEYRTVTVKSMEGFRYIRWRGLNYGYVGGGLYISIVPYLSTYYTIPAVTAPDKMKSYICIKHQSYKANPII